MAGDVDVARWKVTPAADHEPAGATDRRSAGVRIALVVMRRTKECLQLNSQTKVSRSSMATAYRKARRRQATAGEAESVRQPDGRRTL